MECADPRRVAARIPHHYGPVAHVTTAFTLSGVTLRPIGRRCLAVRPARLEIKRGHAVWLVSGTRRMWTE